MSLCHLLKGSGAGRCPGRSHRNDQSSGNKGQCSEVKGTGTISPGKSQGESESPNSQTHLSFTVFHPRLFTQGANRKSAPRAWGGSHDAPAFCSELRMTTNYRHYACRPPLGPAPDEVRHRSHPTCLSSGWDLSSVSLMTFQTVFQLWHLCRSASSCTVWREACGRQLTRKAG